MGPLPGPPGSGCLPAMDQPGDTRPAMFRPVFGWCRDGPILGGALPLQTV
jgi:hypothetical protein